MNIVEFPEQTTVYAKNQPQYRALPAYRYQDDGEGRIACCWTLSWRERLHVLLTGRLWQQILTFNKPLQPQLLGVEKPYMPKIDGEPGRPPGPKEPPRPRMKEVG